MNATTQRRIVTLLAACSFIVLTGCSTFESKKAPVDNGITLSNFIPDTPAMLPLGDRLQVEVHYERVTTNNTVIFVRPYMRGRQAANYLAHPPADCTEAWGKVTGWVAFQSPAKVDEIRITMLDNDEKVILHAISYPVELIWSE